MNKQDEKLMKMLRTMKRFCFLCKEEIFLFCGQPEVIVGGCCIGVEFNKIKWLMNISAHYPCYNQYRLMSGKKKKRVKLYFDERTTKRLLTHFYEEHLESTKASLIDFKGKRHIDFRKEIKQDVKRYQDYLKLLKIKK